MPTTGPSYTDNVDLLLPDIPAGTGFSTIDFKVAMQEREKVIFENTVEFFLKLNEQRPEINLKKRDLIFYGISYGSTLLSWIARELYQKGFKVQGLILDSPYIAPYYQFKLWPVIMKKYNVVAKKSVFNKFAKIAAECTALVKSKKPWNLKNGIYCNDLYESPKMLPYLDPKTNDYVANGYDLRKDPNTNVFTKAMHGSYGLAEAKFWTVENGMKHFNGLKKTQMINRDVFAYVF